MEKNIKSILQESTQEIFQQFLFGHGFDIWKEKDIVTFAGKSKELALAYMIQQCMGLPYVALSKTGDNYAQIGLPISDTVVIRILRRLYEDLKYGIFGESDVADDDSQGSSIKGMNKSTIYEGQRYFYGDSYTFGWSGIDYIITDGNWYYRDAGSIDLGMEERSLLQNKLNKEMSDFTGYAVRPADAVYLADFFAAYQKAVPLFKEISYYNGLLITQVYFCEGILVTDLYVRDSAMEYVRKLFVEGTDIGEMLQEISAEAPDIEEAVRQYLHCRVKSINEFKADYRVYTECYAGGMIYRIMNTYF